MNNTVNTATDKPLAGKSAFITGGSGGIGGSSAKYLLRDGASVTLMARSMEKLEEIRDALQEFVTEGAQIALFAGDAMNEEDVQAGLNAARELTGSLDICVAGVGGTAHGGPLPLLMQTKDTFSQDLDLNILSTFLVIRYATPIMAQSGGGTIVCISSVVSKITWPYLASYSVGKTGVEGLVRVAAEELAVNKIRVNAVRPGTTRTEASEGFLSIPEVYQSMTEEVPLARLGDPDDIAAGVRYLAGPESSWVTGQSFAIDGGNELRKGADGAGAVRQMYGEEAYQMILAGKSPLDKA